MNRTFLIFIISILVIGALAGCDSTANNSSNMIEVPVERINGVNVKPLDREGNNYFYTDTLKNQVVFSVYIESETVGIAQVPDITNIGDMSPGKVKNPTHAAYASLSMNRIIFYKNEKIEPDTNLIHHSSAFPVEDLSFNTSLFPFAAEQIHFNTSSFHFDTGDYEILFQWGNKEGEYFRDTVHVHINLQSF
jgi:hypothetical protein